MKIKDPVHLYRIRTHITDVVNIFWVVDHLKVEWKIATDA